MIASEYSWVSFVPSCLAAGDLICADIGQGLFFRPNSFDGCISISVIQWLCNADKREHVPQKRIKKFFQTLYNCLKRGARAVFQFYPESPAQMTMITEGAMRCGFSGGLVVDFPNSTKAKKYYLCLFAGEATNYHVPAGLTGEEAMEDTEGGNAAAAAEERRTVLFSRKDPSSGRQKLGRRADGSRPSVKSREWIQNKKERQRRQGKEVVHDSKYTGRKRKPKF
jgi:18S rRNA (guanine1575-N7)-methyltransferase